MSDKQLSTKSADLFAPEMAKRRQALSFLLNSDMLIPERGVLNAKRTFFVLEKVRSLIVDENIALSLEACELFFEVIINDAYDLQHNGESVKVITKRRLTPFIEQIKVLYSQQDNDRVPDLKAIIYWLETPIEDWEWDPPWLDWEAITRCRQIRKQGLKGQGGC